MPLHHDIYWIGRQWAVTGHGLQAVNQKLHGAFDIEVSRLWDDGIWEALCTHPWFNPEDFIKGLAVARERYPLPPGKAAPPPLPEIVVKLKDDAPVAPRKVAPPTADPVPEPPKPKPMPTLFDMRIERAPAKFTRLWRIAVKR
jgi:hypothetical protein